MRYPALPLLVVLSAVFGFGRTASEKDTARAIQGAHQLHDSVPNPDSLQVSRALITGSNICIDYRSKNGSGAMSTGIAVYQADKNLLFVDNSWIWQRACLFGKYAQRREGADVTEAVSNALKRQAAPALNGKEEPVARPVPPAVSRAISEPSAHAAVKPARIVTRATARPVVAAPAEPPSPVAKTPAAIAVETPVAVAPAVRLAVPAHPVEPIAPAAQPSVTATIVSAPVTPAVASPQPAAAAPVETHLAGAVIIGEGTSSPTAPESLGDAARRLKREKLQRQQKQVP